jgi:hypothetical protein
MSGSTDFSQWNPGAVNQESDSSYQSDVQRTGGAQTGGVFPSLTANKVLYQITTFVRALALALAAKNYSVQDGTTPFQADTSSNAAVTALSSVLQNLITNSDLQSGSLPYMDAFFESVTLSGISTSSTPFVADNSGRIATTSFVKSLDYVAGSSTPQLIQHGSNGGGTSITFPTPFSAAPDVALGMEGGTANIVDSSISATGFELSLSSGGQIVHWIAIGNK